MNLQAQQAWKEIKLFVLESINPEYNFTFNNQISWWNSPQSHSILRYGAGGNKSAHSNTTMSARKLEETDELKHDKVGKSLSKAIQQARMAKKMTQKDLATLINEKPQVIGEYENGKAIPNGQIISKIERKLGCKLPRPGKKAAGPKSAAGKAAAAAKSGTTRGGPPKRR